MLSLEKFTLRIFQNRFKQTQQRQLDLVVQIELVIDRNVILEHIERIFTFFVAFGPLSAFYHNVGHAVTHSRC
jgi:hypothetical protein